MEADFARLVNALFPTDTLGLEPKPPRDSVETVIRAFTEYLRLETRPIAECTAIVKRSRGDGFANAAQQVAIFLPQYCADLVEHETPPTVIIEAARRASADLMNLRHELTELKAQIGIGPET